MNPLPATDRRPEAPGLDLLVLDYDVNYRHEQRYEADEDETAVHEELAAFLALDESASLAVSADVHAYYIDRARVIRSQDTALAVPEICDPHSVWDHVPRENARI